MNFRQKGHSLLIIGLLTLLFDLVIFTICWYFHLLLLLVSIILAAFFTVLIASLRNANHEKNTWENSQVFFSSNEVYSLDPCH